MSKEVRINYIRGTHITNIGNAFLDIGSEMSLRLSVANAGVYTSSSFPSWFADQTANNSFLSRGIGTRQHLQSSMFFLADKILSDFAVFSGMVVTARFVRRYGPLIRHMRERGVRIVLNGVGPSSYDDEEVVSVSRFWRECGLYGLVSRDHYTYEKYARIAENAYNGIDGGFFLDDAVTLPSLDWGEYRVLTFDSVQEPSELAMDGNVVRACHKLYPTPKGRRLNELRKSNSFISEQAMDYLTIYGNATEVHSDRIHACVAAAAFGRPFRLYSDSKRSLLFERIGLSLTDLRGKLTTIDGDMLREEKDAQIEFLRKILSE